MTCRETKNLLNAYVDGELDSTGILTVESHVQRCVSCLTEVENLQALVSAVENGALRFKAPPHLRRNVQATIRAENAGARSLFFYGSWASALASAERIGRIENAPGGRSASARISPRMSALTGV